MDLLKILRSFEELLFEAMTWLYFYPRTMARIVARPLTAMAYTDREEGQPEEQRYDDSLSPPVLLIITLVIANVIGWAAHAPQPAAATPLAKVIFGSQQNLLMFRCLLFSLTPLVVTLTLLRKEGVAISRQTLRRPFYAQCYLAAPTALALSLGLTGVQRGGAWGAAGGGVILVATAWLVWTETRWLSKRLGIGRLAGAITALGALMRAACYMLLILMPAALL